MAYQIGQTITASDFNAFLARVNAIYSTGTGQSGYGAPTLLASVAAGQTITSVHWNALRTMIQRAAGHQGTSLTLLPPATSLNPNATIYAHNGSSATVNAPASFDFPGLLTAIEANKFNGSTDMQLSTALSLTKAANWSTTTACTVDVAFGSDEAARTFFNTGGDIRISLAATTPSGTAAANSLLGSTAAQDVEWRSIISKVGVLRLRAAQTLSTGTVGVVQNGGGGSQGYYGLSTAAATIYAGTNIGATPYGANDVLITAQRTAGGTTNGANGNTIRFTVTCQDEHTNSNYDLVKTGLQVNFQVLQMDGTQIPVISAAPTFTTVSAWS